jgi:hypothetical protein
MVCNRILNTPVDSPLQGLRASIHVGRTEGEHQHAYTVYKDYELPSLAPIHLHHWSLITAICWWSITRNIGEGYMRIFRPFQKFWEGGGYSLLFCPRNANKSLGTPGRQDEKAETSRGIPRLTPRRHYMPRHGHMLPGAVQGRCSVAAASTLGDEWSISISLGLHKLSGSYAHLKHASTRPHNFQYHLHSTEAPSSGFSTSHLSNAGSDL